MFSQDKDLNRNSVNYKKKYPHCVGENKQEFSLRNDIPAITRTPEDYKMVRVFYQLCKLEAVTVWQGFKNELTARGITERTIYMISTTITSATVVNSHVLFYVWAQRISRLRFSLLLFPELDDSRRYVK